VTSSKQVPESDTEPVTRSMPPASAVMPRMPKVLGSRFEVGRFLADGGMSCVFEGYDRALGGPVVIKFLLPSLHADADAIARFEQEPRVLARLARVSDGFVRPLAAGIHHGLRYLVTEKFEGQTLHAILARRTLSLDEAAAWSATSPARWKPPMRSE